MGNAIICDKCHKVVQLADISFGEAGIIQLTMHVSVEAVHSEICTLCRQCYAEVCKLVNAKGGPDV